MISKMAPAEENRQLHVVQDSVRSQVCTTCHNRPAEAAATPESAVASCEPGCEVFTYLPRLMDVVSRFGEEPPCGYESALRNLPCKQCDSPECDGQTCHEDRPLEAYASEVMASVEQATRIKE